MNCTVLFICTGNYYRSRFAEAVFNHHAEERQLGWTAISRGLAIHLVPEHSPPLSLHAVRALTLRRIGCHRTGKQRVQLCLDDLSQAHRIVAIDETEHRPMIVELFPAWAEKITFWNVADIPLLLPDVALPSIERNVLALLESLNAEASSAAALAAPVAVKSETAPAV